MTQKLQLDLLPVTATRNLFSEYAIAMYPLLVGAILGVSAVGFASLGHDVEAGITVAIGLIIAVLGVLTYLGLLAIDLLKE